MSKIRCVCCNDTVETDDKYNHYCPNCGALEPTDWYFESDNEE